jgi:hypothetical protein
VLWLPNLAWQAANGGHNSRWPRTSPATRRDNRAQVVPLLWLFTGPVLFPITLAGLAWILGARSATPWRSIGIAAIVAFGLVFISGGKAYYAIGSTPLFMAAGAILLDRWFERGHTALKATAFIVAAVISGGLIALLTLPSCPVATYATTSLPAEVPDTANQVGWPQFRRDRGTRRCVACRR